MSSIRLKHASGNSMSLAAPGTNPASNLELKLPHTIGSANQLLKVDGNGQLGWADNSSGVSLSGSTNNTIATVTGANALTGEANLTFDGNNLAQSIDASGEGIKLTASGNHWMIIEGDANRNNTTGGIFAFSGKWNGTQVALMEIQTGQDTTNKDDGQINFYTTPSGGSITSRMVINPDGKVCINNDNALSDLHICTAGSSEQDGTLRIGGTAASLGLVIDYDQSAATVSRITANPTYTNDDSLLKICVDGDANPNQLVLRGDGNIGIGINDTSADLQIVGSSSAGLLRVGGNQTNGVGLDISYDNSSTTTTTFKQNYRATNAGALIKFDSGYFTFHTGTTGGESLRIDSSGKVAIGTITPHCVANGVHIKTNDSGVASASINRDDVFIEGNDHTGITIATPNNKAGAIGFDDPDGAGRGRLQYSHSSEKMQLYTSGTNSFEFTDDLNILDGNLVVASGHGIDFSATSDGTGGGTTPGSELLDDYEEGTWTPTLNTGDFGVTSYSTRYARYTKIGRAVHIVMYIMLSNKGSNSGNLKLWGLPFLSASSPAYNSLAVWSTSMEVPGARSVIAFVNPGSIYCAIQRYNDSSGDANWCTEAHLNNNSEIQLSGTYFV